MEVLLTVAGMVISVYGIGGGVALISSRFGRKVDL